MTKGVNKVILLGHVGNDPEVKELTNGDTLTSLSLATTDSWKDSKTGELVEKTEWHRLVFYKRLAEIAGQYLKKGSLIYIEGSLKHDKYKDAAGNEKRATKIVVHDLQMLSKKQSSEQEPEYVATTNPVNRSSLASDWEDVPF